MIRLHTLLSKPLDYPDDARRLACEVPELAGLSLNEIERLYRLYSEDIWAAGWVSGPKVDGFRVWLTEEVGP